MAQPTPYTPSTDFSEQESGAASGRSTVNTAALDAELANIETTLDETLANLAQIQRDDGALRNQSVHVEALSVVARQLIASGAFQIDAEDASWQTGVAYLPGRVVTNSATAYLCVVAHTSGTFATDLAAVRWVAIAPVVFSAPAASVDYSPSGAMSATNVQAAIDEINTEIRPAADIYMASTYGAL